VGPVLPRLDHRFRFEVQLNPDLLGAEVAARKLHEITIHLHAHQRNTPSAD
jgi:hypothetical protein